MELLITCIYFLVLSVTVHSVEFSYENVFDWQDEWPECGWCAQSPINIVTKHSIPIHKDDIDMSFKNYDKIPTRLTFQNNGHTVQLTGEWKRGEVPTFSAKGIIRGEYIFQQMHFHWAKFGEKGSEHKLNRHSFQAEAHLVHLNSKYKSIDAVLDKRDGLVVLAYTYQISSDDDLKILRKSLEEITALNTTINLKPFALTKLNIKRDEPFYSYPGSLTTPPCTEIVTWFVYSKPLAISHQTLSNFRSISLTTCWLNNIRPIQKLNGRSIFKIIH